MNRSGRAKWALSVAAKRAIARAFIAIGIACLALQAVEVRGIHHSLGLTIIGMLPPVLAVLCGLNYLRLTKRGTR